MSNFKVNISGLEEFQKSFSGTRVNALAAKQIAAAARLTHVALKNKISEKYQFKNNLDSVLVGKSTINVKFGKNIIETGLEYKFKPVPLSDFPTKEQRVSAESKYLKYLGTTKKDTPRLRVIQKNYALEVLVKILRNGSYLPLEKGGIPAFLVKPTRAAGGKWSGLPDNKYRRGIYVRLGEKTWTRDLFIRAPIKPLFGPTLSQVARKIYTTDLDLQKIVEEIFDTVKL